jgi:hypothetical protein
VRKSRGRPAFKPTQGQRRTVERLAALGESRGSIAQALGIALGTLDVRFGEELASGRARRRGDLIGMLFASARKGSVTAMKTLLAKSRIPPPPAPVPPPEQPNRPSASTACLVH